jgi:uncharacterized protein
MNLLSFLFILLSFSSFGQLSKEEILSGRKSHSDELLDPDKKILTPEEIESFNGLDYFPFDSTYQVTAVFTKAKGPKFEMPTTTERRPVYRKYGEIKFTFADKVHVLNVYQNIELSKSKEYKNYLFVPFRDLTSGKESYGGGRYLDLEKQRGNIWLIDFNLAYNPYCAYSYRYSCPIPPKENRITTPIQAGEKIPFGH